MKQNNYHTLILATVVAGAALTACQPKGTAPARDDEAVVLGPQYSKRGLLLPEDTRRSLDVRVAEVTEQRVSTTINLPLRVYRVNEDSGMASGTMTPEQAEKLRPGQAVQLQTADGHTFAGRITRLTDELRTATGTFEILVSFRPVPDAVKAGAFLQARVTRDDATNVLSIPRAALLQCSDGYSVYTVSGEHLVRTPVKVGAANADLVEIIDGLYSGDQVVWQPVMSLWMTELAAVKGGQACCVEPPKAK